MLKKHELFFGFWIKKLDFLPPEAFYEANIHIGIKKTCFFAAVGFLRGQHPHIYNYYYYLLLLFVIIVLLLFISNYNSFLFSISYYLLLLFIINYNYICFIYYYLSLLLLFIIYFLYIF